MNIRKITISMLLVLSMAFTFMPAMTYEALAADTEWGAWSAWQDGSVSASDTRQVETRKVVASYNMETYVYSDSGSASGRGYWPHTTANTLRNHVVETWPKEWVDSARWVISANSYYDSPDNNNCDGMVHDATAYVCVHGQNHDYVPFFIVGSNYKTQYRYRDAVVKPEPSQPSGGSTIPTPSEGSSASSGSTAQAKKSAVKAPKATYITKIKKSKNTCTVTWKKRSCSGYIVRYSTSSTFKNAKKKTVKGKSKTSCKLKGLSSGKKYYIQVCTYKLSGGKKICSKWSAAKSVKIKGAKAAKEVVSTPDGQVFDVIVSGKYAYCAAGKKLVRVTLKTGKKKVLDYCEEAPVSGEIFNIFKKGNYIYYQRDVGIGNDLYRVSITGKNKKRLVHDTEYRYGGYKPVNNKIYYYYIWGSGVYLYDCRCMNPDGTGKDGIAASTYGKDPIHKESNVKGYRLSLKRLGDDNNYREVWSLKKPNKKSIKL